MKKIEIDDELYQYIASNTQSIGESASEILRRLLKLTPGTESNPSYSRKKNKYKKLQLSHKQKHQANR